MRSVLFGFAAVLLAGGTANAALFTNATVGLSIEKPADWCVLSAKEIARDHETILAANPQMRAAMPDQSYKPLYAFTRYAGSHLGLTSTVKVGMLAAGSSEQESSQERLQQMLRSIASSMANVKVVTAPEIVTLAGTQASHAAVSFSMKANGTTLPVALETWLIRRGSDFVLVGTTYPPDENGMNRVAVMKVVNSLQLTN
jgi:hypothetical protein